MAYVRVLNTRIPLDNTYENVITFKDLYDANGTLVQSHMSKEAFFKSYDKYYNNTYYYIKTNFKYGDTLYTELRLRTADIGSNVITGLNYVHVKNTENARYPADLYYFITDILYLSGDIVSLKLELDVYTTYFDYTTLHGNSPIFTKRCHCDRFTNYGGLFGCEEALLPDVIDSQYGASLLKSHDSLFTNYKYVVLYLANNTPRIKYDASGTTYTITHSAGNKVYAWSGGLWETDPFNTPVNGYPAPYIIAVLPINDSLVYGAGANFSSLSYGVNAMYPDSTGKSFYNLIAQSSYVLAMQFTNFDFSSWLTLTTNSYLCDVHEHSSSDVSFEAPAVMVTSITSKSQTSNYSNTTLYAKVGLSSELSKTHMLTLTKREIGLEPKLYTQPYSRYTYTSASDKEYPFEPMLIGKYDGLSRFIRIFTPNPSSNGEMTFITSKPYDLYRTNYMGSAGLSTNELPISNSNLRTYLESQKNSFYTGLGMESVRSMFNIVGGTATGNVPQVASGVINLLGAGIQAESKLKDLRSQPNKISGGNFDIYSIISCTDTNKYINCWSLMDVELNKVSDFYYLNGYEVDMFRDNNMESNKVTCSNKSIITRKLFDYLQVSEDLTDTLSYSKSGEYPLSKAVRDKFNETLKSGVRLWFITSASDYKDFTLENKEIN